MDIECFPRNGESKKVTTHEPLVKSLSSKYHQAKCSLLVDIYVLQKRRTTYSNTLFYDR